MARPGVEITSRAARAARGEPTATGPAFVDGFTERGPAGEPVRVTSLQDFVDTYGNRTAYGASLYDWLDVFFSEGGAEAWVSRVIGPAAAKASVTFQTGAAADALTVEALYEGDYANGATGGLSAQVAVAGDDITVTVLLDGDLVETFGPFDTVAEVVAAMETSDYVRGVDEGAPADPVAAGPTNLAGGTDDHASAVEAQHTAARDLFVGDLGPGQVASPGRTASATHEALIAHAVALNFTRTPLLTTGLEASKATMLAAAAAVADLVGSESAGLFGGWTEAPGVTPNTVRYVDPTAMAAGRINALDSSTGTAGFAAAGDQGAAQYVLDVALPAGGLTDDDYEDLNDAGVNMVRAFRNRGVQVYGFRSVTSQPEWTQLQYQRERMSLVARLNAIALGYVFRTIDGRGQLFGEVNGALVGELMLDYTAGVLYGATPEEAFRVDTGDTVNTVESIAAGEINADVYARFSPFAELVRISITKVSVTGRV